MLVVVRSYLQCKHQGRLRTIRGALQTNFRLKLGFCPNKSIHSFPLPSNPSPFFSVPIPPWIQTCFRLSSFVIWHVIWSCHDSCGWNSDRWVKSCGYSVTVWCVKLMTDKTTHVYTRSLSHMDKCRRWFWPGGVFYLLRMFEFKDRGRL